MYVCICQGVNEKTIRSAMEQGATTVGDLKRCAGVGTACGQCLPRLDEMVRSCQESRRSFRFTDTVATPV
ncbi:MAG: (2Fe-2S)-binding protein [Spirochaetales bacterium]|nr:(2Fe-2S)-binding protein [Spirochaetales bacterium]